MNTTTTPQTIYATLSPAGLTAMGTLYRAVTDCGLEAVGTHPEAAIAAAAMDAGRDPGSALVTRWAGSSDQGVAVHDCGGGSLAAGAWSMRFRTIETASAKLRAGRVRLKKLREARAEYRAVPAEFRAAV